jgi:hypothetical protein
VRIWWISATVSGRETVGCGAVGAPQSEADLADGLVLGRVVQAVHAVDVPDRP